MMSLQAIVTSSLPVHMAAHVIVQICKQTKAMWFSANEQKAMCLGEIDTEQV